MIRTMFGDVARKLATYDDVLAAPRHLVAEVIRGALSLLPRPRPLHARTSSRLGVRLGCFDGDGDDGPGGWVILDEPELHLGNEILVPDLAGWRRERMPVLPTELAYFVLAPDWICEVLSPTTERIDRSDKTEIYAEHHVRHVWFLDPEVQTLEVLRLDGTTYRLIKTFGGDARPRAEPFDAIELPLAALWQR
jgi:Uma2 family endonuclease